eukprot:TRINITY_DN8670_c0_g1_i1.p1 TRINITY_DN8670_c0_g1~~TRINITY_DN8670_c0_g1_i1.p1  ORF type:complete len:607 (+),score=138.11 TRINITY_DN8670_c0_g1_i1:180-2000(+)
MSQGLLSEEEVPHMAEDSDDSGVHVKTRDEEVMDDFVDEHSEEGSFDHREGILLWAKIRGFSYWPGVVTVDPFQGKTLKSTKKTQKLHIHFLAYDNLRAWVNKGDILPYEGESAFKELSERCTPGKRKKDFEPGKKFKNIFVRAVAEAESVLNVPLDQRLRTLGFVYVPAQGTSRQGTTKAKRRKNKASPKEESLNPDEDPDFVSDVEDADASVPKLGSLIWGHMAGFPYWPCFVTRSPIGDYIRESRRGGTSVHVQFFNWNDESGWVTKVLPWCSMAEFRALGKEAMKKEGGSSSDWSPLGKMYHKWKNAALEAESTTSLSRKERHNQYILRFGRIKDGDDENRRGKRKKRGDTPIVSRSSRLPPGWIIRRFNNGPEARTEYQSPDGAVFLSMENAISYLFQQNHSGRSRRKRCYSSPGIGRQSVPSNLSHLPPGPASKKRRMDAGWFIAESDRLRYPSSALRPQISYLDLDDRISYLEDASLPKGWSVKRLRNGSELKCFYLSPPPPPPFGGAPFSGDGKRRKEFSSKAIAASYFEGMGHPAVELEHVIATGLLQGRPVKGEEGVFRVDEYLEHTLRESPSTVKIMSPCIVELKPLPKEDEKIS